MDPAITGGVINQRLLPGAGDVDDCAVAADFMAAHACAPWSKLTNVPLYRAAAGNPDDPNVGDGLTIAESLAGIAGTWPELRPLVTSFVHASGWPGSAKVISSIRGGAIASLSVLSAKLPADVRYAYLDLHRVTIVFVGGVFRIGNPLAPPESKFGQILSTDLAAAIDAYPTTAGGGVVLFPSPDVAFRTHPLLAPAIAAAQASASGALATRLATVKAKVAALAADVADD